MTTLTKNLLFKQRQNKKCSKIALDYFLSGMATRVYNNAKCNEKVAVWEVNKQNNSSCFT